VIDSIKKNGMDRFFLQLAEYEVAYARYHQKPIEKVVFGEALEDEMDGPAEA